MTKEAWFKMDKTEKRDLNLVSMAYFDLFSGSKLKPTKYMMIKWLRKYYKKENENP